MNYRLIIVGHQETIAEMKTLIESKYKHIQVHVISFNSNDQMLQVKEELLKLMPKSDGILYSRKDPYLLMSNQLDHTIPARYVHIKTPDFIKALLQSMFTYQQAPLNISVDTLDYDSVIDAYASVGIDPEALNPMIVDIPPLSEDYTNKVRNHHIRNYSPTKATLCVTNIRSVYEHLLTRNISCVLMTPSPDNYLNEVNSLLLENTYRKDKDIETLMFAINVKKDIGHYNNKQSLFSETMTLNKVSEIVAFYAQELDGLYIQESPIDFIIISSKEKVELVTDHLKSIEVMDTVIHKTDYKISLGIAYGHSYSELMYNAKLGLELSLNEGSNCTHIVHHNREITGPIHSKSHVHDHDDTLKGKTQIMSDKTQLSTNTITSIQTFSTSIGDNHFTSNKLGDYLGISLRSTNRILTKLVDCGYVIIVGKVVTGDKGRPTRLMKFV